MSKIGKFLVGFSLSALLCQCSMDGESSPFFRCWDFRSASGGLYELNFQAIIYPREGVLAYNPACPELSLDMVFNDTPLPVGFDAFERADARRFEVVGIRGRAVVSVESHQNPRILTVRVKRLLRGEVLNDGDTRALEAMAH